MIITSSQQTWPTPLSLSYTHTNTHIYTHAHTRTCTHTHTIMCLYQETVGKGRRSTQSWGQVLTLASAPSPLEVNMEVISKTSSQASEAAGGPQPALLAPAHTQQNQIIKQFSSSWHTSILYYWSGFQTLFPRSHGFCEVFNHSFPACTFFFFFFLKWRLA